MNLMTIRHAARFVSLLGAGLGVAASLQSAALALAPPESCKPQPALAALNAPLPRLTQRMKEGKPVTIVTVGSSSTAGAFATSIQTTYPSRLGVELLRKFPGRTIKVINSGTNGDEVQEMLKRFQNDVFAYQPDLVIWQVGTNGLLRHVPPDAFKTAVETGLARIRTANTDVIMMDLQVAPKVDAEPERDSMLAQIQKLADANGVPLFHRYAVMKAWADALGPDATALNAPDHLHMTDLSYGCLAKDLAQSIVTAVGPLPPLPATSKANSTDVTVSARLPAH